jgi:hypothetical protein
MIFTNHHHTQFSLVLALFSALIGLLLATDAAARPRPAMAEAAFEPISRKYAQLGGSRGFLGEPTSITRTAPDGVGKYRHFAGGSIYWHPTTGAHEVHGAIRAHWQRLGAEGSSLGYPLTDELPTPEGKGRFNDYQHGSIVFFPGVGARVYRSHNWAVPSGGLGQGDAPLSMGSDVQWPSPVIPVCWENPAQTNNMERAWVQAKIAATWEAASVADFVGWGACGDASRGVRIRIEDSGDAPHTQGLGRKLDRKENGMSLNFTFGHWNKGCAQPDDERRGCIEKIAVHEFGHALGFAHEQNRTDAPFNCQTMHQGSDAAVYLTPYDLYSVMNYCNPMWSGDGNLSPGDIQGVRAVYGNPLGTAVTNSTGRLAFYDKSPDSASEPYCLFGIQGSDLVDFTQYKECPNDEARAMKLLNVPAGFVITLADHPRGQRDDDWVSISIKRDINEKVIAGFEHSFEDADVKVVYHRNNGLDGKVSQVVVTTLPASPVIDFFEGNWATQNLVCSVLLDGFIFRSGAEKHLNFKDEHVPCDNDEARSLVLRDVPAGITFRLYDHPDGHTSDDWVEITTRRFVSRKEIGTFQSSFSDADVTIIFYRHNGLDGKVSRFEFVP